MFKLLIIALLYIFWQIDFLYAQDQNKIDSPKNRN